MAPLLAEMNGIKISIFSKEHLPPHFHAAFAEDEILIEIRTGKTYEGWIPTNKLKLVHKWLKAGKNRENAERIFFELNPRLKK
ncbi:MAG: DUF4160 domain-containing protein [Bacteroidetes bacterium]|nr:DUF4160 domain-containing protein [Bacteroidota bacterium]MBK8364676.1 DUF4160 domain-containing protein [Bacteroidota bacterium]MBK9414047.1 DUF4160 domain-containing protein [Bacteroidota bacterium]